MKSMLMKTTMLVGVLGMTAAFVGSAFGDESLQDVMKRRNLTDKDMLAAAKTYTPTGGRDEFLAFSSSGHAGRHHRLRHPVDAHHQIYRRLHAGALAGLRLRRRIRRRCSPPRRRPKASRSPGATPTIPTFRRRMAISTANGLLINDKSTPRIAIISLKDFETRQIVINPVLTTDHGGAFVTNNSEYIIEASQYPAPLDRKYAPLSKFNEAFRGGITYWKFNHEQGRIEPENSFIVEAAALQPGPRRRPARAVRTTGRSPIRFCTERYIGGIESGRPPFEAGCSANDTDFMHMINWKKAEAVFKAGKFEKINGMAVIRLQDRDRRGPPLSGARSQEPAWRRRDAGRQIRHRRRQARHPRFGVRLREDEGADRRQEIRRQGPLRHSRSST